MIDQELIAKLRSKNCCKSPNCNCDAAADRIEEFVTIKDALVAALRSAQQSIADMMGVHGYTLDSGAGEVLREVSAALAAWEARK